MKKYFIFLALLLLISASTALASGITATGFIPGQIWYSEDKIIEGDTVKIYTAVWNNTSSTLSAKVEFYDQNVVLGTRDVVVPPLQLEEAFVSWKVTAGDHVISAKIISPNLTISGKKETVVVDNNSTEVSRKFIPVVIKTINGEPATSSDVIQSQLDKATGALDDILPPSISKPISENMDVVSKFREDTLTKVLSAKDETKAEIDSFSDPAPLSSLKTTNGEITVRKITTDEVSEKPIAYIKLFFLSVLAFLFGSKIVFYSAIVLVVFFIVRWIYRKIRDR